MITPDLPWHFYVFKLANAFVGSRDFPAAVNAGEGGHD
jgi:hypothetical protein